MQVITEHAEPPNPPNMLVRFPPVLWFASDTLKDNFTLVKAAVYWNPVGLFEGDPLDWHGELCYPGNRPPYNVEGHRDRAACQGRWLFCPILLKQ
jgi:hypothetical protein